MGKSTISMAIFNSYVKLPEGMFFYSRIHMFFLPEICYIIIWGYIVLPGIYGMFTNNSGNP